MANKQNFTPEEWTKVLEGTMLAGIAVSQADPAACGARSRNTSRISPH